MDKEPKIIDDTVFFYCHVYQDIIEGNIIDIKFTLDNPFEEEDKLLTNGQRIKENS